MIAWLLGFFGSMSAGMKAALAIAVPLAKRAIPVVIALNRFKVDWPAAQSDDEREKALALLLISTESALGIDTFEAATKLPLASMLTEIGVMILKYKVPGTPEYKLRIALGLACAEILEPKK